MIGIIGNIVRLALAIMSLGSAYFIFQTGDAKLTKAGLGFSSEPYTIMLLTTSMAILLGLLMVLSLLKTVLIKYIPPLILVNGILLAWLMSNS